MDGDKTAGRISDEWRGGEPSEEEKGSERQSPRSGTRAGAKETGKYKIAGRRVPVRLYALILGDCLAPSPEDYN